MKILAQHMVNTFLTLTNLESSYQTHHFEIVSFSTLEKIVELILFTTGTITRVGQSRINKSDLP